jgi:hypothetical protein
MTSTYPARGYPARGSRDDDDPRERQRLLAQAGLMRRWCVRTSAAMGASPLTVRIDLDTG